MDVSHVAKLANLTLTDSEIKKFQSQFAQTIDTIAVINELDTSAVVPSFQVTGLSNVLRPDEIDQSRVLTQHQVLSQASQTHKGFVVVPAVIDHD
ncbi:hypothetical protein A2397_00115 [Candidatus Amesbacteria bacterium RIFOXYB1_FULL_44_23]|uniref:Asp/Glu-ADT subunit C n=1 Tax=Candidatus Amesbacteria bacterium RIFOXYB1_FULL_44_23 TaxID=1797263 RepID=A0A1F4ZWJ5_9BACT|nr:MAG: hypothetical protein A2397_00115 [Candidatus Amesbacteria bacterium RIFOXYB1_FULL_44_23]